MNKRQLFARLAVFAMVAGIGASQAALDAQITTDFGAALANVLLVIALGGAGLLTIAGAKVGWTVAAKFIGRLGGKA